MDYNRFQKLNRIRINALHEGDYKTYSSLCNQMGIEPEDNYAIEKAEAEKAYWRIKREKEYNA